MTDIDQGWSSVRRVIGNISLSLDGRTTGPGGDYDMSWVAPHAMTDGSRAYLKKLTSRATTVLLGRKNYQGFSSYWPGVADDDGADPRDRAFSVWLNDVEKVIFSRTLDTVDWKNARLADADLVSTVRDLRAQDGGDILVLASASIIRSLLETGDLDGLSLTLCPEIVGGGARLFDDGHTGSSWSVREMTPTESGGISLVYDRLQARP